MKKFLLSLAAFVAMSAAAQTYVINDDAEGGQKLGGWGGSMKISVVEGNGGNCYEIDQPTKSANNWEVQVAYDTDYTYEVGTTYTFEMDIKGTVAGTTFTTGLQNTDGYKSCGEFGNVNVTTEWQHVKLTAECNGEGAKRFIVSVGDYEGKLYVDNLQVYYGEAAEEPETPETPEEPEVAEPVVLWTNETGDAVPAWGGVFRFANEESKSGEEIYAFPMDVWSIIKDGTFRVAVEVSEASNIRITTGWWTADFGGKEHNCLDMVKEEADGTKYIEINIKEEGSLYENLDAQHLLFTGSDYKVLSIYTVGGADGINNIEAEGAAAVAYDLFGRAGATKGFMVKGGLKVYVK